LDSGRSATEAQSRGYEGLERVARLVDRGEMLLFTSVITHTEVLASKMEETAKKRYAEVFQRPEVIEIAVDNPIAVLASEIRDFYIQARDRLPVEQRKKALTVSTPDALHLATAIYYEASEFHTFDGDDSSKSDGLLRLGNKVATYSLNIRKPDDQQLNLLHNVPPLDLNDSRSNGIVLLEEAENVNIGDLRKNGDALIAADGSDLSDSASVDENSEAQAAGG
jgi:predicted nucleic acid-binding protein